MEYGDYEYYEPGQAEMIMDEFMGKMREALSDTAKNEIETLRRENEALKESNAKLRKRDGEVSLKARQLEDKEKDLERAFYRKKFNEFLEPFLNNIEVYFASHEPHTQPKCEFCDDERKLIFAANNGKTTVQMCECAQRKYWHEPKKTSLQVIEFYKRDWNGKEFVATAHFDPKSDYDDRYLSAEIRMIVDRFSDETLQMIDSLKYRDKAVFKSQEECQKYCDQLNSQG